MRRAAAPSTSSTSCSSGRRSGPSSDNPVEALRTLSKQFGYSPQTFEATLRDQTLLDNINAVRARGSDEFKVDSTPTFFVNGEQVKGAMTPEGLGPSSIRC